MNYIEYIHANANRIGIERQEAFTIETIYEGRMEGLRSINHEFFQYRVNMFSHIPMTRDYVRESYNHGYYTGFVATILWGGLGLTNWSQLVSAATMDKSEVDLKLLNIQEMLEEDRIRDAFMSMQASKNHKLSKQNKLSGVDISYFTKILYFMYNGKSSTPPLIFDKWGTFIHAGILISLKEFGLLDTFYDMGYNKKDVFYISVRSNQATDNRYKIYDDYLHRMSSISTELNLSSPDLLEEFLFGKDLKSRVNKNDTNPRYFVKHFVEDYYKSKA